MCSFIPHVIEQCGSTITNCRYFILSFRTKSSNVFVEMSLLLWAVIFLYYIDKSLSSFPSLGILQRCLREYTSNVKLWLFWLVAPWNGIISSLKDLSGCKQAEMYTLQCLSAVTWPSSTGDVPPIPRVHVITASSDTWEGLVWILSCSSSSSQVSPPSSPSWFVPKCSQMFGPSCTPIFSCRLWQRSSSSPLVPLVLQQHRSILTIPLFLR